jgi:hypothetical protein
MHALLRRMTASPSRAHVMLECASAVACAVPGRVSPDQLQLMWDTALTMASAEIR